MEEDAKMPRRSSRHNSSGSFVRQVDSESSVVRRVSRARNSQPKSTEEESSPDVFENGPVTRRRARRLYSSSTAIKTELLNGVNEGESPLSADTNKSINSTNHRSPPLKKKRLSVDMPVRRRGRPRTRDIQSNHFNHSSASPRRSKREKRLIYRNLSARSIEKEVFKPPIIVDSDGSDTVDPYEKILSPHHRIQLKTEIPTGSPVQMLTRRQRRLLGAGLEQPTDESTPLKTFAAVQTGNSVVRDANKDTSANDRWRSLRLRSCNSGEPPAEGREGELETEGGNGEIPQQELEKQEEEDKGNECEITETGSEEEGEEAGRSYNFRKRRPVTYQDQVLLRLVPQNETQRRKGSRHRTYSQAHLRSPAYNQRGRFSKRRRHTTHRSSSSTSSSGEDSDEKHFQRRKSRSMNKARQRCLPVNITHKDMNMASFGTARDRQRVGASLADVDPMNMDQTVSFGSIGGLQEHIQSLKEMVVFPLLYPEVFKRFNIAPPRGVLFHGAPGCGKTLVARALANECSKGERKVSFFMRKGADCLSKWVGESERQLRLLFDQAYQMRPSIIFFDEIDGLAPVRSSKQDQIHSSIVSTLLALMDGLDNRGEIVVIGATNRIDAIDPAFRRPGRFDREFFFPLPSLQDRIKILQIHTLDWKPKLRHSFLAELAEFTVGYCGADLKALCAESALAALRRIYPQIYATSEKLVINPERILVQPGDFLKAMEKITPASQRVELSPASSLTPSMQCLLSRHMRQLITMLMFVFPAAWKQIRKAEQLYREVDEICTTNRSISCHSESTPMDCVDSNNLDEVNNCSGHSRDGEDTHLHKSGGLLGKVPVNKLNSVQTGNSSTFSVETILSSSRNEGVLASLPNRSHPNPRTDCHTFDSIQGNSGSPPNTGGISSSTSYQRYTEFYSQMSDSLTGSVYVDPSQSRNQPNLQNIDIYEEDRGEEADTGHVDGNNPSRSQPTLRQLFSKRVLSVEEADPHRCPNLFRTRLLICGRPCMGQTQHLGPALLHALEGFTQHVLDLSALYSIAMRTPEEACHQIFREAKRTAPSIVYLPNMELWWNTAGDTLKSVFTTAAKSVSQTKPLLLLATYEGFEADATNCISEVFDVAQGEVFKVTPPTREERRDYFQDVVLIRPSLPPLDPPKVVEELPLEELPKAAAAPPQELTEVEKKKLVVRREATLRELRVFLRDATNKLMAERKFKEFTKPVDPDEVIDYYDVISKPMDLSTVMKKIDERCYQTAKEWLTDIDLITSNALEYNPENSNESRLLRHRACELQDMAHSFMDHELSEDFEKLCHDLKESAQRVGIQSPVFHPTIPQRSSHRKSHGDEFSNLSDDDEMALYRRRSLRQQGVEPQVEGIPYYGPRRARKRAAIDEDEDDDDEVTDNGWKSGESFDNERNSGKDTDKEKSDAANETDTLSIGEDNDGGDKVNSTEDGKADKVGSTEDCKADKEKNGEVGEEPPKVTEKSTPDFEETFDNDGEELSSESELIVDVMAESRSPEQGHSEGEKLSHDTVCTPGDDNLQWIEPENEKGNSDVSNHTPDKLMVKYPKSVISISVSADGEGKSPTAGNPDNITSPSVKEDTNSKASDVVLETQNGKRDRDCSVVEVPPQPREVRIDRVRQLTILDSLVGLTEGCNLEVLQKLHSMLGLIVFRHRMEEDRSQLLNEMELLLNTFFKS